MSLSSPERVDHTADHRLRLNRGIQRGTQQARRSCRNQQPSDDSYRQPNASAKSTMELRRLLFLGPKPKRSQIRGRQIRLMT
jgi:hypothetical protein